MQGPLDCHMPGYINRSLTKYQHPKPVTPQHAPYKAAPIQHGARVEFRGLRLTPHNHSSQKKSNVFKTTSEPYCTMHERLIKHFLPHSAQLQHNKPMAHGQWQMHVTNSSITLPLTQMQTFDTKLATWYFLYTQTPPTFPNLVVKAEQQDIFTFQIAMVKTSTMAPYSHC